jgi:hypothetical protein
MVIVPRNIMHIYRVMHDGAVLKLLAQQNNYAHFFKSYNPYNPHKPSKDRSGKFLKLSKSLPAPRRRCACHLPLKILGHD